MRATQKTGLILTALFLASFSTAHAAEIEDTDTLGLFTDEQPVATSPIPRPISKIAENVTVITADDILRLNAHTLAEVLQTVPGIQLDINLRTPTTFTFFNVQGAHNSTVIVLVDGIRQNDHDQNQVAPGMIPVQQIERIEIIKGAASGSWGSALGGVINIVTKSPDPDSALAGMVSSSIGSHFTTDNRAELSGTKKGLGYYLTAGHIHSDGLSAYTAANAHNIYGKVSYTLPSEGTATVGVSHVGSHRGEGEGVVRGRFLRQEAESERTYGFLKIQQPLGNKVNFDLLGYANGIHDRLDNSLRNGAGEMATVNKFVLRDSSRGVNASVSWGDSRKNVVAGGEYAHLHGSIDDLFSSTKYPGLYDRSWESFAGYCTGTYSVGKLSILPGVRFDSTGLSGDHMSYTLGLTYEVAERTTLRAYAAHGFSLPMLTENNGTQKVRTAQGGIETGALPFLWLKGTYFFNALRNAQSVGPAENATTTDQNRQGFELEGRTTPLFGLSLRGGYTYLYAEDMGTHKRLQTNGQQSVPPHVYKVALDYEEQDLGVRGTITGSGVAWNAPEGSLARSKGMVWDLNLSYRPASNGPLATEIFFSAHNLFNAVQTTTSVIYDNATRWFEGGARLRF